MGTMGVLGAAPRLPAAQGRHGLAGHLFRNTELGGGGSGVWPIFPATAPCCPSNWERVARQPWQQGCPRWHR